MPMLCTKTGRHAEWRDRGQRQSPARVGAVTWSVWPLSSIEESFFLFYFVVLFAGVFLRRVFLSVASSGSHPVLQQQLGTELAVRLRRYRRAVCFHAAASRTPPAGQYATSRRQPAWRVRTTQTGSLAAPTLRAGKCDEERVDRGFKPGPSRPTGAAVRRRRVRRWTAPRVVSRHRGRDASSPWRAGGRRRSQQCLLVPDTLVVHRSDGLQRILVIVNCQLLTTRRNDWK